MEEAAAGSAVSSAVLLSSGGGGEFAAVGSGGEATSVEEKEKQRRKKEKKKKEKEEKKKEKEEKEKHKRDKKEEKEREKREREKEREEKEKAKRERKEEKEREKKERKSGLKSTSEPVLPQVLQHSSPQHGGPQAVPPLMGSLPSTPVSSNQPQQASPTSPTSPSTQRRDRRNTDLFGVWRRSLAGKRDRSDATSTLHQQTHSQPEERRGSTPPRPSAAAFQAPPLAHSASVQSMPAVRRVAISAGAEKRLSKESPDVLQQTELRKYNAMRELGAESMQYIEKRRSMEIGSYGSLGRKTGLDAINEFNSADPIRKHSGSAIESPSRPHSSSGTVPPVQLAAGMTLEGSPSKVPPLGLSSSSGGTPTKASTSLPEGSLASGGSRKRGYTDTPPVISPQGKGTPPSPIVYTLRKKNSGPLASPPSSPNLSGDRRHPRSALVNSSPARESANLLSSPSKGEDTENAQLVQRFKNALRKNVEQIEAQVKVWETQIFSPELRAKMSGTEMKKKSDTVLSMHKTLRQYPLSKQFPQFPVYLVEQNRPGGSNAGLSVRAVAMLHHSRELEPIFWEFFAKCTFLKEKTERIESLPDCIALGKVIKALKEELKSCEGTPVRQQRVSSTSSTESISDLQSAHLSHPTVRTRRPSSLGSADSRAEVIVAPDSSSSQEVVSVSEDQGRSEQDRPQSYHRNSRETTSESQENESDAKESESEIGGASLGGRPSLTLSAPISIPVSPRYQPRAAADVDNHSLDENVAGDRAVTLPDDEGEGEGEGHYDGTAKEYLTMSSPVAASPVLHSVSLPASPSSPLRKSAGKRGEVELFGRDGGFVVRRKGGPDGTKKRGYLVKLSGIRFAKSKKRWFGFQGGYLVYWRLQENEDDFPLGEYDMRMCSVKEAKLPNKTNTFALITPKRNIYLQASTYKDMLMWMNAMNDAKKPSIGLDEGDDEIDEMTKMIPREAKTCGSLMMLSERQSTLAIPLSPLNLLAGNQKWSKRWFVIEDGFLTYYKKKQDTEFAGLPIDLLFCSVKELEVPGQKHCFQLVGKDDVAILLHSESENEMLEWIGSLRDAITSLRANVMNDSAHSPQLRNLPSGKSKDEKESKRDYKEESTATASSDDAQAREVRIVASGGGGGGDKPPLSESEDGKEIILQGFLKKQTHSRFTKYKKRWCMLSADSLTYYENKPTAEEKRVQPSGSIQILFAMAHELPLRERSGKEIAYPFEVLTANRNFVFVVDSEEVRSEWVNAIKDLNAKLMKTQLQHTLKGRQRSIASMLAKSGSKLNVRALNIPEDEDSLEGREYRKNLLFDIAKRPGNNVCADCGQEDPDWASINLGITLCIECAGVHRSLGAHITKVRSLDLDDWEIHDIRFLEQTGNELANQRWLQLMPPSTEPLTPSTDVKTREEFIKRKYTPAAQPVAPQTTPTASTTSGSFEPVQ